MRWHALAMAFALVLASVVGASAGAANEFANGAFNPFGHSPIRIVIDASNLTSQDAAYANEVRQALAFWENGGNGALRWKPSFVETANRTDADIVLWFLDTGRVDEACDDDEAALGCAAPFERPVPIELLARLQDGTFRSFQQVREVSEHEIGHALGLPHSPNPDDIMFGHASAHAAQSWRPGDLLRLGLGAGAILLIIGAVGFVLVRVMRPTEEFGEVKRWESDHCPAARDAVHDLQHAEIDTPRGREEWEVCLACRQGRPRP